MIKRANIRNTLNRRSLGLSDEAHKAFVEIVVHGESIDDYPTWQELRDTLAKRTIFSIAFADALRELRVDGFMIERTNDDGQSLIALSPAAYALTMAFIDASGTQL